jgi:heptose-I-phosphate ethanolaminephosphotransferase
MKYFVLYFTFLSLIPLLVARTFQFVKEGQFLMTVIWAFILLLPILYLPFKKIIFTIISILMILANTIDLGHIFLFQGRITRDTFAIILDTNLFEANEFLADQITLISVLGTIGFLLISLCGLIFLIRRIPIQKRISFKKYLGFFITLPFVIQLVFSKFNFSKLSETYFESNNLSNYVLTYYKYQIQLQSLNKLKDQFKKNKDKVTIKNAEEKTATHILVLGESTTRNRMSLYGYKRETSPNLKSMNDDLIVMKKASASNPPGTLANIYKVMTFRNSENEKDMIVDTHLVNIMKAAHYKTFWISNQLVYGKNESLNSAIGGSADMQVFLNSTDGKSYDEKVIPVFEKILNDPAPFKFIVIHLIGTHMRYKERYPSTFYRFIDNNDMPKKVAKNEKKSTLWNQYDNARSL